MEETGRSEFGKCTTTKELYNTRRMILLPSSTLALHSLLLHSSPQRLLVDQQSPVLSSAIAAATCSSSTCGAARPIMLSPVVSSAAAPFLLLARGGATAAAATTTKSGAAAIIPALWGVTTEIQSVGEKTFLAIIAVCFVQAALALFQYRSNPAGELIFPPGPTIGYENAETEEMKNNNNDVGEKERITQQHGRRWNIFRKGESTNTNESTSTSASASSSLSTTGAATAATAVVGGGGGGGVSNGDNNIIKQTPQKQKQQTPDLYSKALHTINRCLFFLSPLFFGRLGFLWQRQVHLFHFAFIMFLARIFDVPATFFNNHDSHNNNNNNNNKIISSVDADAAAEVGSATATTPFFATRTTTTKKAIPPTISTTTSSRDIERVVIIGDSLAIGIGSVDVFDTEKNNSVPMYRIENLDTNAGHREQLQSPAFSKALAASLSRKLRHGVHWRSAGVDGGSVDDIRHYCLDVIKEEVDRNHNPDLVVVICGMNDLKEYVGNPFKAGSPKQYRQKLTEFIAEIKTLVPNCRVVLPAIPTTQLFQSNSPLNIFPLALVLDAVAGFWDSQKKLVADSFPSNDVMYLGMSTQDVSTWYEDDEADVENEVNEWWLDNGDGDASGSDIDENSEKIKKKIDKNLLIASDGIHPTARCYTKWAETMCERFLELTYPPISSAFTINQQKQESSSSI